MKKVAILSLILCLFWTGCASKPDLVKVSLEDAPRLEKNLNTTTGDRNEKVGVKDNTVKVQKIMYLEEELARLQTEITDLENTTYGESQGNPGGLYFDLKQCREKLSDPRVGGTGNPEPMEKWERISEKDDDFNYHVDKQNNVIAVSEEDLAVKITNLKKMRRMLKDKFEYFKGKVDGCENKYRTALVNHGLDPRDTEAKGEWVEGPNGYREWKMKKPKTSDPEELMRRKQQREGKSKRQPKSEESDESQEE